MKVRITADSMYTQPEIRICCNEETAQIRELRRMLESILSEKITVFKNYETQSVTFHEIVRIYSESKKIYLRTSNDIFEVRNRLYMLEEKLKDRGFLRISNTEIVNISQIEKLDMTYTGTIKMFLKNGDTTFVSRRYVSKMKQALKEN